MDPSLPLFSIQERAPGRYSLRGELDMSTAPQLRELEDVHGPLLLDFDGVSFLDSTGISGLIRLHERCPHAGCTLLIERCSRQAEQVLRIVGLYEIFTEDGLGHDLQPSAPEMELGAAASD